MTLLDIEDETNLLLLKSKDTVLNSVFDDKAFDKDGPLLAKTMDTVEGLVFDRLTPSEIQIDNT